MAEKSSTFLIQGMNKDMSNSSVSESMAYHIYNMRMNPIDSNTLGALVNEKGTKEITNAGNFQIPENMIVLGVQAVGNYIIIFGQVSQGHDFILKVEINDSAYIITPLLQDVDLNFSKEHPIETLSYCENTEVQKVYWVDGKNYLRYINIMDTDIDKDRIETVRSIIPDNPENYPIVNIEHHFSGGYFPAGTTQYLMTYFVKYGVETKPFYISPQLYNTSNGEACREDLNSSDSYTLTLTIKDTMHYDGIRVYSLIKTEGNSVPASALVKEIFFQDNQDQYVLTDTNMYKTNVDINSIYYLGSTKAVFNTFTQKDNTLFLGNYSIDNAVIDKNSSLYTAVTKSEINWEVSDTYYIDSGALKTYTTNLGQTASDTKTFMFREYYKFGVQGMQDTGEWSEVIPILEPSQCDVAPKTENIYEGKVYKNTIYHLPQCNIKVTPELLQLCEKYKYKKLRAVVLTPDQMERNVICQGIMATTVTNVLDSKTNSPTVQSSWFYRPMLNATSNKAIEDTYYYSCVVDVGSNTTLDKDGITQLVFRIMPLREEVFKSEKKWRDQTGSNYGDITSNYTEVKIEPGQFRKYNRDLYPEDKRTVAQKGKNNIYVLQFKKPKDWNKWYQIFADTQGSSGDGKTRITVEYTENGTERKSEINDVWILNQQVKSASSKFLPYYPGEHLSSNMLPSSEIQCISYAEAETINDGNYQQGVDFVISNTYGTIHSPDVEVDTDLFNIDFSDCNVVKIGEIPVNFSTTNVLLNATATTQLTWLKDNINVLSTFGKGSLAEKFENTFPMPNMGLWADNFQSLDTKRYSNDTMSQSGTIFTAYAWHRNGSMSNTSSIGNTNVNGKLETKCLYSMKFSTNTRYEDVLTIKPEIHLFNSEEVTAKVFSSGKLSEVYYGNVNKTLVPNTYYPIAVSSQTGLDEEGSYNAFPTPITHYLVGSDNFYSACSIDPVLMKYKSTPHLVVKASSSEDLKKVIIPKSQPAATNTQYGYLSLVNVERGRKPSFGGDSNTLAQYIPAGEEYIVANLTTESVITAHIGDTYLSRFDSLKTYPYSDMDQNQVIEVLSFYCQSRLNMDGRFDVNRGNTDNFSIVPSIWNRINYAYTQKDDLFTYRVQSKDWEAISSYPNSITWTTTKVPGNYTDAWLAMSGSSVLELDGNRGTLNALRNFNNNLFAFQDNAINHVLYNEQYQFSTEQGVPIEIGNSGKVQGKRIISDTVGCQNKWSIADTASGLYFIDGNSKGIYCLGGEGVKDISINGMKSWVNSLSYQALGKMWSPQNPEGFVTHYDPIMKELLFINRDYCLAYNEAGVFTSFYAYKNSPHFINHRGHNYWIKPKIWEHQNGEYNSFFGETDGFYVSIICNKPEQSSYYESKGFLTDKIFNNVEYRADSFDSSGTYLFEDSFDCIEASNEYQSGKECIYEKIEDTVANKTIVRRKDGRRSYLQKKFKIWRMRIPRDTREKRDRIRGTWAKITLSKGINKMPKITKRLGDEGVLEVTNGEEVLKYNNRFILYDITIIFSV